MGQMMTTEEVSRVLNTTEHTVRNWARNEEIPAVRIGGSWRFPRDQIESISRGECRTPVRSLRQEGQEAPQEEHVEV